MGSSITIESRRSDALAGKASRSCSTPLDGDVSCSRSMSTSAGKYQADGLGGQHGAGHAGGSRDQRDHRCAERTGCADSQGTRAE